MSSLKGKTILIGVSGGIAAYKACELTSMLVKRGAAVHVAMTRNATEFVAPLTFEALSHNRVTVDTFDRNFTWEVEHVALAKKADAVIVAPATANVIAKLACGIADDFLTTTVLACKCRKIVAPAMNTAMLENIATKENLTKLAERGYEIVYGQSGRLACGDSGSGRMAEPQALAECVERIFAAKTDYAGKTVLVTAGATRAELDPVRYITNRSSGKMGYNIAMSVFERGADVIFVKGFTNDFDIPKEWKTLSVATTDEMFEAVAEHTAECDYIVCAAAPCDYTVKKSEHKIKSKALTVDFSKARDIAAWVGEHKKGKLVIFAAETENCECNAAEKLSAKKADMVVMNDVTAAGAGFDCDTNIVTFITAANERTELPLMSKRELAERISDKMLLL